MVVSIRELKQKGIYSPLADLSDLTKLRPVGFGRVFSDSERMRRA